MYRYNVQWSVRVHAHTVHYKGSQSMWHRDSCIDIMYNGVYVYMHILYIIRVLKVCGIGIHDIMQWSVRVHAHTVHYKGSQSMWHRDSCAMYIHV